MTKQRDLVIFNNRAKELSNLTGVDFLMKLTGNHQTIKMEVEKLDAVKAPSPDLKKYQEAAAKLYKEYAAKDKTGAEKTEVADSPQGPVSKYVMDVARENEFYDKLSKLRKENLKVIEEADKRELDYMEALDRPVEAKKMKFELISKAELPKEINAGQMQLLSSVGMLEF